jgi:hypothetical protein
MSIYHDFRFHLSSDMNVHLKVYIARARLPSWFWNPQADTAAFRRCPPDTAYVTAQVRACVRLVGRVRVPCWCSHARWVNCGADGVWSPVRYVLVACVTAARSGDSS